MKRKATATRAVGKASAAIATLALGGWAFKKWRDKKRQTPSYPAEATPRVPPSDTRSPS